ncbi:MAG: anhydro-N-acetylmuramic acid kinase [Gammaproteobacteria bacterium]|jgi:anhydro-N-acetylmuramic acid kinase|nr:anhydro-N-acetylmuramic acid kinase [Gammaproteobacteria bacterium]MDP6617137.1 anhydro-N-acetylmuramic acid kinase [Gammaproteobacteria bacterium]MDP6695346.1 anhydro-N-acetylmuramic acid kinase [Gammaproteobacteria bacterium]MDP7041145.1 anhydro-N-acetylmuramic acid kinase [Gammaproteobacteria bacterium]
MEKPAELYLGLMTGTSLDAVDAALVSFSADSCALQATLEYPFPPQLRDRLLTLIESPDEVSLDELGAVERELGLLYAEAVTALLESASTNRGDIVAIGCHGQTVRHRPDATPSFTMQIGDAATLANQTGITTVADFRSADIALGGQGAPLVPPFHQWLVGHKPDTSVVVNIGGIANISVLRPGREPVGFDTGPGNTLLDGWCARHTTERFDNEGTWAAGGRVIEGLLNDLLEDPYFRLPPPKSSGREYFNIEWLEQRMTGSDAADPVDVQATLAELTAASISLGVLSQAPEAKNIWLCGGGALNKDLCRRIAVRLPDAKIQTTDAIGLPPAWVEAVAFAWLARARLNLESAGAPSVTGAARPGVLGAVHRPG